MYPFRQASTSGVSIVPNLRGVDGDPKNPFTWGLAATAVRAGDVRGPRAPVAPVAGDGDRGLGVPDRVVRGHGSVDAVDLPVAEVVGRAVGVLPAAGFGDGDLGRDERRAGRAARRLPQCLEAGAAEVAAQFLRRG